MKLPGRNYNHDDYLTEIGTARRLRRKERREEMKAQYHDKNGEVVKYLPTPCAYLVTSGGERLATLREV